MPLESVTHISDLVVTNPTSTDPKSEGDNHLRNIKTALKTDFPNISGPVTKTHTQLNNALDKTGDTMTGNLNFSGTALRLTGDFSNATVADRLLFHTSTPNTATDLTVVPNGTSTTAFVSARSSAQVDASALLMGVTASTTEISSARTGAGSFLPMRFLVGGPERFRIETNGNVLVTGSGGLGYGTGSGGTVTQATSKTTAVTLNKPSGQITMDAATLNAGGAVTFQLNNSFIANTDQLIVTLRDDFSPANYSLRSATGTGGGRISVTNISAGNLSEAVVLNFAIIKGAIS